MQHNTTQYIILHCLVLNTLHFNTSIFATFASQNFREVISLVCPTEKYLLDNRLDREDIHR